MEDGVCGQISACTIQNLNKPKKFKKNLENILVTI